MGTVGIYLRDDTEHSGLFTPLQAETRRQAIKGPLFILDALIGLRRNLASLYVERLAILGASRQDDLMLAPLFYSLVCMNLLFATATWCLSRPTRWSATATALAALLWLFGNGQLEGRVLLSINYHHGLTVSDLLSMVAFAISIWGFVAVAHSRSHST
ncbi:hypothetical protein [Rhodococcus jostii]|uniref:Uncharacterized protein n=1 Tax=Rhodococcus jostii TaxID=132919 RepID=A0ABU4C9Q3_RHOJO|nr:hypothetical protein [Rhodococcus jostii]MDV6280284.1 hypothetical protein [Rhodococcus jostii]